MNLHIENGTVLLDSEDGYHPERLDLYIQGNRIAGIGRCPDGFVPQKTIDATNQLIIPGLINCHTHTYMSVFRNLADDLSFSDWLFDNIMPREDKLTPEDAYWGAMLSCMEMIKTGTTTFLDMHMFKHQTALAAQKTGMRAVISRGLSGEGHKEDGLRRIKEAKEEMERFANESRITFMYAPHAIYTCDTEYLSLVLEEAKRDNLPLHVHLSETTDEFEQCLNSHGMTPVAYLDSLGLFEIPTVAAHCVQLTSEDIDLLARRGVNIAANPKSNLKLGNGYAPIPELLDAGVNICLGTDSQASNNTLNLFSDMNYTALIHKGTHHNAETISANDVLSFATRNGAKALQLSDGGSIKEGALADLTILDLNVPQFMPRNNLTSALVYSANGSEVNTVIIDGEVVLEQGHMTKVDELEIYEHINDIMTRIQ